MGQTIYDPTSVDIEFLILWLLIWWPAGFQGDSRLRDTLLATRASV